MAEINGIKMTDEQFMLSMELGKILQDEGYDAGDSKELDIERIKSERGRKIAKILLEISNGSSEKEKEEDKVEKETV